MFPTGRKCFQFLLPIAQNDLNVEGDSINRAADQNQMLNDDQVLKYMAIKKAIRHLYLNLHSLAF